MIEGSTFSGNVVDPAAPNAVSAGGALYLLSSTVAIRRSRFSGNRAGWVGGAIYAFGQFREPASVPDTLVEITGSEFVDNLAEAGPAGAPAANEGGAILVENQTTVRVSGSRFVGNRSEGGGALFVYRGQVELEDVVFRGNRAGQGAGAVQLVSLDKVAGDPDRRNASLTATTTLFEGDSAGGAGSGGCISASGDVASLLGLGVPQRGTAADHRAPVHLAGVIFSGCLHEDDFGAVLRGELVDLLVTDSLFLDSQTTGSGGGGAINVHRSSTARFERTTFAGNASSDEGGALRASGSQLDVVGGAFLDNRLPAGLSVQLSQGAALLTQAAGAEGLPATGSVTGAVFSGNVGLPIFERDNFAAPFNAMRYDGNVFFGSPFGDRVFSNPFSPSGRNGSSVAELDALVVAHSGGSAVDKSAVPNQRVFSPPPFAALVEAPSRPWLMGPAAEEEPARLGFAWSGGGATLAGSPLGPRRGLVTVGPGTYGLSVDGVPLAAAEVSEGSPCDDGKCLETAELPGFLFRVLLNGGAPAARLGRREGSCLAQTLCVSGATPGHTEVLVRLVGPKPDGLLWPTVVRLTTVRVEVWVEQVSTGEVRHLVLPAGPPGVDDLSGRVERNGFVAAATKGAIAVRAGAATDPPPPPGDFLTTSAVPGFRFKVRVAGPTGPRGRRQSRCLAETLCVSGVVASRTDLLVRIVGPRANGFLWPTIATFSTLPVEVWIEQTRTRIVRFYRLPATPPESDTLAGLVDRRGFRP